MKTANAFSIAFLVLATFGTDARAQLGPLVDLGALGAGGAVFDGAAAGDEAGWTVARAGDVNGDGTDDFLVGARGVSGGAGAAYLVYGAASLPGTVNLSSVGTTVPGVRFTGGVAGDNAGWSVAGAGDVNADGYDDILIGAPMADGLKGRAYLVYGGPSLPSVVDLSALGVLGVTFLGVAAADQAGFSVAGAGDVNGDGKDDFLVGARLADPLGRVDAGQTYLVFGDVSLPSTIQLPSFGNGVIFVVNGGAAGDMSGFSLDGAGDVNGDGHPDLLIGARHGDPGGLVNAGQAYVVYGGPGLNPTTDLGALGSAGISLHGCAPGDVLGFAVAGGADVNGDGFADPIAAARQADPGGLVDAGETYVLFGGPALPASIVACNLGCAGVRLPGVSPGDQSGFSVAAVPDLNEDGYDDVLIGAPFAAPTGMIWQGESYLVHGSPAIPSVVPLATLGLAGTRLRGAAASEVSGYAVAEVGDPNADGELDLAIGAFLASPPGAPTGGRAYLVFGKTFTGGAVTPYGTGCPGTGGLVPRIGTSGGAAQLGDSAFRLWIDHARPLESACVLIGGASGSIPLGVGCAILVDPAGAFAYFLLPMTDACGEADLSVPIPADPTLANQHVFAQGGVFDPMGVLGVASLTAGLDVLIRP